MLLMLERNSEDIPMNRMVCLYLVIKEYLTFSFNRDAEACTAKTPTIKNQI